MKMSLRNLLPRRERQWRSSAFCTTHLALLVILVVGIFLLLFLNAAAAPRQEEFEVFPFDEEEIPGASQESAELIAYIKQLHIQAPVGGNYKLQNPEIKDPSQNGQGKLLEKIFKGKKRGSFIEAGAYNGEDLSNTLYLEKELDWTGLLVEPDPWNYWSLRKRSRNSYSIQCCLSPFPYPREVTFRQSDTMGKISDSSEGKRRPGIFTRVKCFPLYSLMLARNLTNIDLLSLDIEGKEFEVLKTLPWNDIKINAILLEVSHIPQSKKSLKKYLESKNYQLESTIGEDMIFVRDEREMSI